MSGRRVRRRVTMVVEAILLLALARPAHAQPAAPAAPAATPPPSGPITATVDKTSLSTDETLRLRVEVNAASMQLSQLRQPVFDGFAIVGSTSSSRLEMRGGVPAFMLGYDYALQPVRSGDLVVPSFSIDIGGQTYSSAPIPITVTPGTKPTVSPAQAAPGAVAPGQRFFITAAVDKPEVWQGEQLVYTFRFYQAANLAQQPAYGAPPFTGFWQRRESSQRSDRVLVGDRLYLLTELDTYLFPTRSGDIEIPAARLSLVGDLSDARNRLATDPITVHVRPLPADPPADFGGAVGRYALSASAVPADVAVDEPVHLSLTLSGDGNVETAPDPAWPDLDGWQSYDDGQTQAVEARDGRIVGQRTWRRLFVPSRPGSARLPAVRYSYFDPIAGRYATAETSPIAVQVRPGAAAPSSGASTGAPSGASSAPDRAVPPAAAPPDTARWRTEAPLVEPAAPPPGGSIAFGRLGDGRSAAGRLVGHLGYWLLWLGPFAVVALDLGRLRRARQRAARRDAHAMRVAAAAEAARRELAAARRSGAVPAVALASAVRAVLSAAIGARMSGLALEALPPVLAAHGLGGELAGRAVAALQLGDAAAWQPEGFAADPATASGRPASTDAADADALVQAVASALARAGSAR